MRIKKEYALSELSAAREIIRAHPFATLVTPRLRATHMPCLVAEEDADELVIVGHVARADPVADDLDGPLLAVFIGPHGYVSGSWYERKTIPTWNYVTLHARGVPTLMNDAMPVLRRTVDHFESVVREPWSLDCEGDSAREMADQVVAFRLRAQWWHAEAKLSQDRPENERARVLTGLQDDPAYANPALVAAMRQQESDVGQDPGS